MVGVAMGKRMVYIYTCQHNRGDDEMTRDEAQRLINSYCCDPVTDETAAIERLMEYKLTEFDNTDDAETQNRLDDIIYG